MSLRKIAGTSSSHPVPNVFICFERNVNESLHMQQEKNKSRTHQLANNTKTQRQTTTQLSDGKTSGWDLSSVNLGDASQ
jgi:hypothetical protein